KVQKISLAREQFSAGMMRESVFMVGDSLSDIRAAKEAGIQSIAVAWGHQSLDRLLSGDPDHVVRSVQELLTLFAV
ncbi:MAG TPA: HAD hydrolase-like protein, partial [Anaerolineales bacterium]|nr:HAD hydrolase-like protein [Anaerolineales bacterium]